MRAAALLLIPVVAAVASAQNPATDPAPVITGTQPGVMLVNSRLTTVQLTLYGKNFWPSGPNNPDRWRVYMRRDGGAFQEFRLSSGNNTQETFSFPSRPWIEKAGRIEIRMVRDGVASNVYSLEVRATPPTLSSIRPKEIAWTSNTADKARYTVSLDGSYWVNPTTVWIDGREQGALYQNLNSGHESYEWPVALRKPGRYAIHLQTEHGKSGVHWLEIVAPPTALSPVTPRITSGALKGTEPNLNIRIRFAGSPPAEAAWRTDRSATWRTANFGLNIRNDEADVDIPMSQLAGGAYWIDVRLKNIGGEGVARIMVDQTVIAGGPPKVGMPAGGAAATPAGRAPGTVVQPPPVTVPAGTRVPAGRPGTPGGARPAVATPPGAATPATAASPATAATPATQQGIIVQGGRTAAPASAAPAVARPATAAAPATAAPVTAAPASGIVVQGGRTATSGIVVQGGRTSMAGLRTDLQRRLGADASRVTATMQGSTLVLSGTVRTEAAKQSAAQAAAGVAGVTAVRNDIRVAP